ncbi:DUF2911 domain-containing protein [Deminuibacter soli]|uniref:DUF2911 domain-containing protein n=1 Tax=Deminuibacter soli TaxID=2291815 RepID=A0A3E1NM69_9BACT|nr:DUF2911 domain-containing protein [Deminuibacter soli]RFM29002.1 DUF2911 domain-containing protein [Deminuibacter soli]
MKRVLLLSLSLVLASASLFAQEKDKTAAPQEKKKPASPHEMVSQTIKGGTNVTIHYGSPSVKGRTIGTNLEPMNGKIWRAGADSATTFEVSKNVTIEGQSLPAGKYAFFVINNNDEWTLIFNKAWQTWGAYSYDKNKDQDALQVKVTGGKAKSFTEKLTYTIDKNGTVTMLWGDHAVTFHVKA